MTQPNATADVQELVRQRDQIRGWIARLDEVSGEAPTRVSERIRADYQERLERVTAELSAHREEIERDLESLRAQADQVEERRANAVDVLEETRLRHLIGELDEQAWDQQRPALEGEVAGAEEELARARAELERISALAAEVSGTDAAPEPESEPEPEPAPAAAFDQDEPAAAAVEDAPEEAAAPEPELFAGAAEPEEEDDDEGPVDLSDVLAGLDVDDEPAAEEPPPAPRAEGPGTPPESVKDDPSADSWDPFGNEFSGSVAPGDAAEDLPWLDSLDRGTQWSPPPEGDGLEFLNEIGKEPEAPAPGELSGLGDDDLAFLEELDRAISGPAATPPAAPAAGAGPANNAPATPGGGTPPAAPGGNPYASGGRLLCKECGALNEPHSWYCEICGSEL